MEMTRVAMEGASEDEYSEMDFEIPLSDGPASDLFARHNYLLVFLDLDGEDHLQTRLFTMLAALCDPLTQPEDNEKFPLSVEALGQVALSLSYQMLLSERESSTDESGENQWLAFDSPEVASLRFTISLKYFNILQAINKILRADDELRVRYLKNDREDWKKTARHWLPEIPSNPRHDPDACLKILYYISCVVIMGLYKLFFPEDGSLYNAALNPYSEYFLRLWKTHTSIIALALEMDRELEEEAWASKSEYLDTPDLVKKALLGSSAVRTVLAWILEQIYPGAIVDDGDSLNHDICKSPLLSFYDPLMRTANSCGCIMRDEQLLMVATLILRSQVPLSPVAYESPRAILAPFPIFDAVDYQFRVNNRKTVLGSAGDLMVDLYYHDQFDEDIKYVFGYYESDEETTSDNENDKLSVHSEELYGTARRAKKDEIEFDEEGRDWRDCARGENVDFTDRFLKLEADEGVLGAESEYFYSSRFELEQSFVFLASVKIESVSSFVKRVGQVTVDTVAKAIKAEQSGRKEEDISPNHIHLFLMSLAKKELLAVAQEELPTVSWGQRTTFDLIFFRNPECAQALLDELFMCKGLRRSLIWYLTRCADLSMTLINYIYELVSGLRGNSGKGPNKYLFSRKGALELSQVEKSMALHELFGTASRWALDDTERSSSPEQNTIQVIRCLCVMIRSLMMNGIIKENTEDSFEDYSHDLQVLLFPWIGKVPDARELFFKIKQDSYRRPKVRESLADNAISCDDKNVTNNMDILDVLDQLEHLDYSKYWDAVGEPSIQLAFREFGQRLFYHICRIYNVENVDLEPFETPKSANEDFYIFLTRFNEFSKNKMFVRNVFSLLEGVSLGERPEQMVEDEPDVLEDTGPHQSPGAELMESEFNDAFLNGEGQFQDVNQEKTDDKKKKKKKKEKKKRRGKH